MPNPLAHPAASIPFTRVGLVFSALVFGSISPDLGYVVPLPTSYFMYTPAGLILFDVPVGFVLLFLFHTLAKWPLLAALPESLQRRLFKPAQGFSFGPAKHFALIILSLLVGSITHVIWDSFTHEWGWMVERLGVLHLSLGGTPLYAMLQTLGTALGVCLMAYWFIRWLPTTAQSDQLPARFSGKVRALFLALATISLVTVEAPTIFSHFGPGAYLVHEHGLVHGLALAAVLIVSLYAGAYCLAWMMVFRRTIRPAA